MRRRRRRSKRSAELMRVTALETGSSFWPEGESAEPSGPWKPWVVWATEISGPAGRTAQPEGVTAVLAGADAGAHSAHTRAIAGSRRRKARFIGRSETRERGIRRGYPDGTRSGRYRRRGWAP